MHCVPSERSLFLCSRAWAIWAPVTRPCSKLFSPCTRRGSWLPCGSVVLTVRRVQHEAAELASAVQSRGSRELRNRADTPGAFQSRRTSLLRGLPAFSLTQPRARRARAPGSGHRSRLGETISVRESAGSHRPAGTRAAAAAIAHTRCASIEQQSAHFSAHSCTGLSVGGRAGGHDSPLNESGSGPNG